MIQIAVPTIRALQLPGGADFTAFVDGLIRTHATRHNLPDSAFETNIRTNLGDQGADSTLQLPFEGDTTGWFETPTIWQYKATAYTNIGSSESMLEGAFVRARLEQGFAFRLAVADSITSAQRRARVAALDRIARALNPTSPGCLVSFCG
jgi:hypothetical protein